MATEDIVGRDLGGDTSQIVQSLKDLIKSIRIGKKATYTSTDPIKEKNMLKYLIKKEKSIKITKSYLKA